MPRRPRIQLDKVPLHIVQRGHNREACFFGEEDYQSYLHWLAIKGDNVNDFALSCLNAPPPPHPA